MEFHRDAFPLYLAQVLSESTLLSQISTKQKITRPAREAETPSNWNSQGLCLTRSQKRPLPGNTQPPYSPKN